MIEDYIPFLSVAVAGVVAVSQAFLFVVYRAHGKDATAHAERFDQVGKDLDHHNQAETAHNRSPARIGTLENDFRHVIEDMSEIKDMLRELMATLKTKH